MHRGSRGSLTSSRYGYGPRTKGAHSADGTPPRGSQQGTSNSPSASPTMAGNDENNQCPKCDDPSTNQMIECSICLSSGFMPNVKILQKLCLMLWLKMK